MISISTGAKGVELAWELKKEASRVQSTNSTVKMTKESLIM